MLKQITKINLFAIANFPYKIEQKTKNLQTKKEIILYNKDNEINVCKQ